MGKIYIVCEALAKRWKMWMTNEQKRSIQKCRNGNVFFYSKNAVTFLKDFLFYSILLYEKTKLH